MKNILLAMCLLVASAGHADINELQTGWAEAMYALQGEAKATKFEQLAESARELAKAAPEDPEVLIWQGIVLSTYAGEKGGLGALGLVKEARTSLEAALALDPAALDGSAYTSLGSLYYKVPGWPIGFGSAKKARQHLVKALELNPRGMDANFFMGEFLFEEGESDEARAHLETALNAPNRPGRETADEGRRAEIRALIAQISDS